MENKRFNPKKLQKLNNPIRLEMLPVEELVDIINLKEVQSIIDFGAGTGLFSRAFSEFYPSAKIYACDIAIEMIEWMQENITKEYPNIIPFKTDEKPIELNDESAHLLTMINLHHEINNHVSIIKDCYRLLKKGGKILISDWKKEETDFGPPIHIRVDADTVKIQLESVGFKNIKIYNNFSHNYVIIAEK